MAENYGLKLPGTVLCGKGSMEKLTEILDETIQAVTVITDKGVRKTRGFAKLLEILESQKVEVVDEIAGEPDYHQVQAITDRLRENPPDLLIAVGGGSAMDTTKLASILLGNEHTVQELLKAPQLGKKRIKTVMIPTTAGTGAEATPNGIVAVPEEALKVGIVNAEMIPDHVILDPELLKELPRSVAAATGADALSHAIECFTSNRANPFSDLFALESMELIFRYIERMYEDPEDMEAAEGMMRAAFYAGIAITSSGTTAVHALSYPLGGKYHIAHGIANAMLLASVMRFNCQACRHRLAQAFDRVGDKAGVRWEESQKAEWMIERLEEITERLQIPKHLSDYGIREEDIDDLVSAGLKVTRLLNNNCRPVTAEDAEKIYRELI